MRGAQLKAHRAKTSRLLMHRVQCCAGYFGWTYCENIGAIFFGAAGDGKDFETDSTANASVNRSISGRAYTPLWLLTDLQRQWAKLGLPDVLELCGPLILDDLGSECGSDYAPGRIFMVIAAHCSMGYLLIMTTNPTAEALKNPVDLRYERIYAHIAKLCMLVVAPGHSCREGGTAAKTPARLCPIGRGGKILTHTQIRNSQMQPGNPLPASVPCGRTARESMPSAKEAIVLKKQFLGQYADNEREIRRLEEEICRWESRAEKMTGSFSHAPSHRGEDRVQSAVDEIVELRNLLYDRLVDATELRRSIAQAISAVPEQRLRLLLEYRYIDGMTWEGVAAALTCDYRWTLRLHDRALAVMAVPSGITEVVLV